MNNLVKKILEINLDTQKVEAKSFDNLNEYIGGIGIGLKLVETYKNKDPLVIAIGPLSGFFPFVSKTAIVLENNGNIEDLYLGGSLASRIKFAGLDAIVIIGKSQEATILNILDEQVTFEKPPTETAALGLPGKRSVMEFKKTKILLDKYFKTPDDMLEKEFVKRKIAGLVVTGTKVYKPKNFEEYTNTYKMILSKNTALKVNPYDRPACVNCTAGCLKSEYGELGGNVLLHSLVACGYAEKIYADIGLIFLCLNLLGYQYTHEDLERLPNLIEKTLQNLSKGDK